MADTESKQSTVAAAAETTKEVAASAVEDTKEAASAAGDKVAVATGVKEPESPTLLGQTISTALDAVDKVVTTVKDFDEKYAAGKARLWVEGAISVVSGAAKNLKKQAQALREDPASVRRLPGAATTEAVSQLRAGLNYLSEMARSYDEQYQMTTSLRAAVDTTKETANRALSEITAQVQRVTGRSPRDVVPSIADSDGKSAAPPSAAAKDALADASAALADASHAVQDESKDAGAGVRERVAAAYGAVQDVATRVREFEARNVDAAKGAFAATVSRLQAAAADLKQTGIMLKEVPLRDVPRKAAAESLARAEAALAAVTEAATKFDEEHRVSATASSAVSGARARATAVVADALAHLQSLTNRVAAVADRGVDAALSTAVALDGRLGVSERAKVIDEKYGITKKATEVATRGLDTVKAVDAKLGVTATAASLDERYAGGRGTAVVNRGVELAGAGVGYITGKLAALSGAGAAADAGDSSDAADGAAASNNNDDDAAGSATAAAAPADGAAPADASAAAAPSTESAGNQG